MWVFGYGSLLWNPGFEVAERQIVTVAGYVRSFCMWSIHHRGTVENPGLVLALDAQEGGECIGVAMRVAQGHEESALAGLRARELVSSAYKEVMVPLDLPDKRVNALSYIIDPGHVQYCAGMALEQQAQVIASAAGGRGPNPEYLYNTTAQLAQLGLHDPDLHWLEHRVRALTSG
jgi:cation transport protein ChaC